MTLVTAAVGDRIDLTVVLGQKNVLTIALWNRDTNGNRVVWDESVAPTVIAQVRDSFSESANLIETYTTSVQTPSLDGVDTLTVTLTVDLTGGLGSISIPANADDNDPVVQVGVWDFRLNTDDDAIVMHPLWGDWSIRRRVSR